MKKVFLFLLLCVSLQGFSQFSLSTILPVAVSGNSFGDTLLNTPAIMQSAGIKKIIKVETDSRTPSFWHREFEVWSGRIVNSYSQFHRSLGKDSFTIALTIKDTLLYHADGQLTGYWQGDAVKEASFIQGAIQYLPEGEVVYTWMVKDPQGGTLDTTIVHYYYNEEGRLVRQATTKGYTANDGTIYYDDDGFIESIKNDKPGAGFYSFTHKKKGNGRELSTEGLVSTYNWQYNASGQCIRSYWSLKKGSKYSKPLFSDVSYSYNADGTLKKVVEKSTNHTTTVVYSYVK